MSDNRGFAPLEKSKRHIRGLQSLTGFTLIEVLFSAAILAFCICGLLATYVNMFLLSDVARDTTLATNAVQAKMEELKREDFTQVVNSGSGPFNLTDYGFPSPNSKGRIDIQENFGGYAGELTRVRISASFRSRDRLIGEDLNLNGVLDAGEDANGNNVLDSPVEVVTLITK